MQNRESLSQEGVWKGVEWADMTDCADLVYLICGKAWEDPEQDVIWSPPPAIVSLCFALDVHKSFYHREKQYILGFGFSFPIVSTKYNGSGTATGIDPVFDPDQRV